MIVCALMENQLWKTDHSLYLGESSVNNYKSCPSIFVFIHRFSSWVVNGLNLSASQCSTEAITIIVLLFVFMYILSSLVMRFYHFFMLLHRLFQWKHVPRLRLTVVLCSVFGLTSG